MCGPEGLGAGGSLPGAPAHAPWHRLTGSEPDVHQRSAHIAVVVREVRLPPRPLAWSPCLSSTASQHPADLPRASMEWLELKLQLEVRVRFKELSQYKSCGV